jgi:hypothetical protein
VYVLVSIGQETSPDVLCGYIGKLWSSGDDGVAGDLSKARAVESTGKLYAGGCGTGWERSEVMTVTMSAEGGRMSGYLEHFEDCGVL